jgi:hypothetical protein
VEARGRHGGWIRLDGRLVTVATRSGGPLGRMTERQLPVEHVVLEWRAASMVTPGFVTITTPGAGGPKSPFGMTFARQQDGWTVQFRKGAQPEFEQLRAQITRAQRGH